MPHSATEAGSSISPQLHWGGFPPETRSFALTCFDPDTPTPPGQWHQMVLDLAPEQTSLSQRAGKSDLGLDGAAFHIYVDHGGSDYFGATPPKRDRPHRHIFAIHALDLDTLGLDSEATPAACAAQMLSHTIAHARITVTHETPWVHPIRLNSNSLALNEAGQDKPMLHLVFFEPEIPGNSGAAVRLSTRTGAMFHPVEPLNFGMDDTRPCRAGLDYRDLVHIIAHPDLGSALARIPGKVQAFTGHAKHMFTDVRYSDDDGLLFGREPVGLSEEALSHPRVNTHARIYITGGVHSLNLASSTSIVLYRVWGSLGFPGGA